MKLPSNSDTLTLWAFFRRWQQLDQEAGHQSVDLGAYLMLLEALSNGLTLGSRDALKALCRAVLVKPHHKLEAFEREFEQIWLSATEVDKPIIKNQNRSPTQQKSENEKPSPPPETKPDETPAETNQTSESKPEVDKPTKTSTTDPKRVAVRFDSLGNAGDDADAENGWEQKANEQFFQIEGNYEPIEERAMHQYIRQLRNQTYRDTARTVDLNATIERVSQRGIYDGMVRKRTFRYEVPVTLLLDRRGSMVPFHHLSDQLKQAVEEQPDGSVRYFQNHFEKLLFKTPHLTNPESFATWKNTLRPNSLVMVVSDAGAARGFYIPKRIEQMCRMVKLITEIPNVFRMVWLNPMPRDRWWATSAEAIAELVPMYALDETEIGAAIKTLNGQM